MVKQERGWLSGIGGGRARALLAAAAKEDGDEFEGLMRRPLDWEGELSSWTVAGRSFWLALLEGAPGGRARAAVETMSAEAFERASARMARAAVFAGNAEAYGALRQRGARVEWDGDAMMEAVSGAKGCMMLSEGLREAAQWSAPESLVRLLDRALFEDRIDAALLIAERLGPQCARVPSGPGGDSLMLRASRKNSLPLCAALLKHGAQLRQANAMGIDAVAYSKRAFGDCALYAMFMEWERRGRLGQREAAEYLDAVIGSPRRQEREEGAAPGPAGKSAGGAVLEAPLPFARSLAPHGDGQRLRRALDAMAALRDILGYVPQQAGLLAFLEVGDRAGARRAFEGLAPLDPSEEEDAEFWSGEEAARALAALSYCALRFGCGPGRERRRADI